MQDCPTRFENKRGWKKGLRDGPRMYVSTSIRTNIGNAPCGAQDMHSRAAKGKEDYCKYKRL